MNPSNATVSASIEWALSHGLAFKTSAYSSKHCPFTLTPASITRDRFNDLTQAAALFAKLIHGISQDEQFIEQAIAPIAASDPLFSALLNMHQRLSKKQSRRATPLLIMRTDFMDDCNLGPKLIEFNAIAAGMGPFGQRTTELHRYIASQHRAEFSNYSEISQPEFIPNAAIINLANAIAIAARTINSKHDDGAIPTFLMIVQENEDNVYDQHLLEYALQQQGIRTLRKTFFDLHQQLSSGNNHRLLLQGEPVDVVYLRAGYQQEDYCANTLVEQYCCSTLMRIRMLLEQHDIAMNATIGQQLASSKRVQMLLSNMNTQQLMEAGLTAQEAQQLQPFFGEMLPLTSTTINQLSLDGINDWVLKNQGEGGGHCIFGEAIITKLKALDETEYQSWSLMRKIVPSPRSKPTLIVRDGNAQLVANLVSEIGIFTVTMDGATFISTPSDNDIEATINTNSVAGYLVRSKPADVSEGGVHSGQGALDSLIYQE